MDSIPSPTTTDSTTLKEKTGDLERQEEVPSHKVRSQLTNLICSFGRLLRVSSTKPTFSRSNAPEKEHQSSDHDEQSSTGVFNNVLFHVRNFFRRQKPSEDLHAVRSLSRFIRGYPNLAAFHSNSENFMIYRRFGYLSARVLLEKQDQLRRLEEELDEFDDINQGCSVTTEPNQRTSSTIDDRNRLLTKIDTTLGAYATSLMHAQQLMGLNKPSHHEQQSVSAYLENHKPVKPRERGYVHHKEDLITLRPGREHAWLDRMIEASLQSVQKPLPFVHKLFCSKETRMKVGDSKTFDDVYYYTRERIDRCASALITLAILVLLIVPVWLLYYIITRNEGTLSGRGTAICIGTLLISTLLFSAVLSLFTKAKRHEILAAAAAYCAVLVVFLGNVRP
ncbi:hypothetical protein M409DRAFT_27113 [Zasmidium cellare ATCC 36951]|uniref:DUF6594 domain-containing protein n=1 Tax=Zasmidium cellare ATCC 36951 TaxID=1080233 RepID=A0A6A6C8C5_ZASCE|nr:uncharacterized protein M409DRAFT_27113 [Zasmidium cellare ATCC 36951]KAF2162490.1 hypothetical protein M409DRAFT_27113 [Zasmidium cellare ATCC 36951]